MKGGNKEISGSPLFISHSRTVSVTSKEIHSAVPLVSTFLAPMKRCFLMCSFRLTICEATINSCSEAFFLSSFSCSCSDYSIIVLNHVRKECIQYIDKLWIQMIWRKSKSDYSCSSLRLHWVFRFCLEISLSTWKCKKQCPLLSKAYKVALQYNSNNTEMLTNNETAHTKLTLTHLTFLIHFMPRFKSSPWKGFFKSSNFSDRKMTVKCHLCVGKG